MRVGGGGSQKRDKLFVNSLFGLTVHIYYSSSFNLEGHCEICVCVFDDTSAGWPL